MMPSQFSKEDHIIRISKSVFASNFSDSFRSCDLWKLCEPYGKVVGVFIHNRKSKDGKRFAFVRFIKVGDFERLIGNLCTLWVGRFHLHANAARYERPINSALSVRIPPPHNSKLSGSYVAAVNGSKSSYGPPAFPPSPLALVLDDTCINECDFSRHVMGKVKDLNSIPNLQTTLAKEGFAEVKLSYLGGFWVLLELDNANTKEKLLQHTGVNSWFLALQAATNDFVCEECVVWVDIEGIPLNVWSHATFLKIGKKWGEVMDVEENLGPSFARKVVYMDSTFLKYKVSDYISDDEASIGANNNQVRPQQGDDHLGVESDEEGVSETIFGDKPSSPCNSACNDNTREDDIHSEDLFGFYDLLNKPSKDADVDSSPSLSHPPGFTLEAQQQENIPSVSSPLMVNNDAFIPEKEYRPNVFSKVHIHTHDAYVNESSSGFSTSKFPRIKLNGGSIIDVLDDMIKVGKSMGYDMEGCSKDIERIIGETIVMGDFNDVQSEDERYDSTFIPYNARAFNHFISSSSLLEMAIGIPIRQWLKICSRITLPLDIHISLDEIQAAVWECGENKSPYVLHAFGFGPKWCKWIRGIFSSAMASILINGSLTTKFPFFYGLKQGDPLAPLLFKGLQLQESVSISHLFYADDAVFIGEWSDDNLVNLIRILNCFHLASGLKINVQKSQVLGVGVSRDVVNQGATLICCAVMHNRFKCLGVMVGDIMSRHSTWVNTIQKIQARLSKWKVKTLSVGDSSKTKITWVAWNKTLASKKNGSLGVSSFHALNRAFLLKWVWRFLSRDGSLWSQVIGAIHGASLDSHSTHTTAIWCSILREVQVLSSKERIKDVSVAVKCGDVSLDGSITLSFAADRWVCNLNGDGEFRVKDIRSSLDDLFLSSMTDATRWVKYIPVKVNVFVWRTLLDRLPTREVKARLNFDERSGTSRYSEPRMMNTREHERRHRSRCSHSPRPTPSFFSRIRRDRSRLPRQNSREGGVFKRFGNRGKSVSACSDSYNQRPYLKYTEARSESEDSGGGHWKSRSKKHKSSRDEDDLSQPWAATKTERQGMPTWCHMFNSTLMGNERVWFDDLPDKSIDIYDDLKKSFLKYYLQLKKCIKDPLEIHNIKQLDGESTEDFVKRYKLEIKDVKGAPDLRNAKLTVEGGVITLKSSKMVPLECVMVSGPERNLLVTKKTIEERVKGNLDIFAWKPADMTGDPRHIVEAGIKEKFSAKKSLPFYKTLKKCTKNSDFHWIAKAKEAFKQMKKLIAKLSMLVASMEKEELIVYLAAAKETILFTGGSTRTDGSGAGLILINLEGMEFAYALRFRFGTTNNKAKYKALISELRIAEQMGVNDLQANVDSQLLSNQVNGTYMAKEADMIRYLEKVRTLTSGFKAFSIRQVPRSENKKVDALSKIASTSFAHPSKQVLVEELKEKSISNVEIPAVVEKERDTWMTPIFKYLMEETLPADVKKARAVRRSHNDLLYLMGLSTKISSNHGCGA
nr:hypothetical protein [Tanacetum cinerariifolium]